MASKHDESVLRRAAGVESWGWIVEADVPGFPRPRNLRIGSKVVRPDIVARKGTKTKIIEVETLGSWNKDKEQRKLLRDYARKKGRTEFMARRVLW